MRATKILLMLVAVLLSIGTGFASEKKIEGHVFEEADSSPFYWATEHYGVPRFMSNNFKYPREAWAQEQHRTVRVICVICKDGSVVFESCDDVKHPALLKEIKRVVEKMHWVPAMKNGHRINLRYSLYLPLCQPEYLGNSAVPYGFESYVKAAEKCAARMGKRHVAYTAAELAAADSILEDAATIFPQRPLSSIAYSRLQSSLGRDTAAVAAMDYCLMTYNPYRFVYGDTVITHPSSPDYSGRREMGIAVMRAVEHCFHRSDASGDAIELAGKLIDDRMVDGKIADRLSEAERAEAGENIQRMMRDQINELIRTPLIEANSPLNQKVGRLYSAAEISNSISAWSNRGEVYNAQTSQLASLLVRQDNEIWFGKQAEGDMLNLLGAKAFVYWLACGNEGVADYVAYVRRNGPSKKVSKYLDRLEKRLGENADMLADREGVVRSLACLVPPAGSTDAEVSDFYARRDAAERVFPLRWLMK